MESTATIFGMEAGTFLGKVVILVVAIAIATVVDRLVSHAVRKALDASKVPSASIFINVVRGFIWAFALLCVLEPVFGISPTAFVAALGVSSVVISFGLQDTVSNVIGGLALMGGRILEPGDRIRVSDLEGEVTDVTWRSTFVRSRVGDEEVIPNSVLMKSAFVKLTPCSACECELRIVVNPAADPATITADVERVVPQALGDHYVAEFGCPVRLVESTAMGTQCVVYLHVADGMSYSAARDLVIRGLSGMTWMACALPR
jgi:small-conductance mechanosensitive channel